MRLSSSICECSHSSQADSSCSSCTCGNGNGSNAPGPENLLARRATGAFADDGPWKGAGFAAGVASRLKNLNIGIPDIEAALVAVPGDFSRALPAGQSEVARGPLSRGRVLQLSRCADVTISLPKRRSRHVAISTSHLRSVQRKVPPRPELS